MYAVQLESRPDSLTGSSKIQIKPSPETAGMGVYVKAGQRIEPGEILTEYPGPAKWMTEAEIDYQDKQRRNPYVFSLGPFKVPRTTGIEQLYLCWDASSVRYDATSVNCGHLLNTMSPVMASPWNVENCVFALYLNDLNLFDATGNLPEAHLYIMSTCVIDGRGLSDDNNTEELLLDYHYVLASEFGLWCLQLGCSLCKSNLLHFVKKYISDDM